MKLTIDNKDYVLNVKVAIELGVLIPVAKPIFVTDLKVGDIFKFKNTDGCWITDVLYKKINKNEYVRISSSHEKYPINNNKVNGVVKDIRFSDDTIVAVLVGSDFITEQ